MTHKGITYTECRSAECRFIHLVTADGRTWAEWTHPQPPMSPFVRRALARELPAKETAR